MRINKKGQETQTMVMLVGLILAIAFFVAAFFFLFPETSCRAIQVFNVNVLGPVGASIPCPDIGIISRGGLDAKIVSYGGQTESFVACKNEPLPFSALGSTVPATREGTPSLFGVDIWCDWYFSDGSTLTDLCEIKHAWAQSGVRESVNLTIGTMENSQRTGVQDSANETVSTTLFCINEFTALPSKPVKVIAAGRTDAFVRASSAPIRSGRMTVTNTTPDTKGLQILIDGRKAFEAAGNISGSLVIFGLETELRAFQTRNNCIGPNVNPCDIPVRFILDQGSLSIDNVYIGAG